MAEGELARATGPVPMIDGYSELTEVGRGGYSVVYRAWEDGFQRTVAIKVLNEVADEATLRRFAREQAAVGRLSSVDGVLTVYGQGRTATGQPYITMPYLASGSLADRLERTGPLQWTETAAIMAKVARAVDAVNGEGIIHGDLKPHNIITDDHGRPQLVDFGVARLAGGATATSTAFTPAFAAPEVLGHGAVPTAATDVYGLGVCTAALLLGRGPFSRPGTDTAAIVGRILTGEPDLPENCPDRLRAVLAASLGKDPASRPTAQAFAAELDRTLDLGPSDATTTQSAMFDPPVEPPVGATSPPDPSPEAPNGSRARPSRLFWAAAAIVIVAVGAIVAAMAALDGGGQSLDDSPALASGTTEPGPSSTATDTTEAEPSTTTEPPAAAANSGLGGGVTPLFADRAALPLPPAIDAPTSGIRDVALGGDHSCAIDWSDRLWCWGEGTQGELGLGDFTDRDRPTLLDIGPMAHVGLGGDHTCGLDQTGQALCWGANKDGQLGDGTRDARPVPTPVSGAPAFARIAVGGGFSCGLETTGAAWCWGSNDDGQLGDGSFDGSTVPVPVGGEHRFAMISAGGRFACGLTLDREVWCWGDNEHGQLGDDAIGVDRSLPVPVGQLDSAEHLASGDWHACAVEVSGLVQCWGRNDRGQIGDRTRDDRPAPIKVLDAEQALFLAVDGHHSCVYDLDARVQCWGANASGELGDGTFEDQPSLVPVGDIDGQVVFAAAGNWHGCVVNDSGQLFCFGGNGSGELGLGDQVDRSSPGLVLFDESTG